jgi:predicted nucleotide-binding protein
MAKSRTPETTLRAAQLGVDECKRALPKIDRRLEDLQTFPVDMLTRRFDPKLSDLKLLVNNTLRDILGADTSEYAEFEIKNLDVGGLVMRMDGSRDPPHLVREYAQRGLESAVGKLTTLRRVLEERIADNAQEPAKAPAAGETGVSRKVFLVHGHDVGTKEMVARFLEKLSLDVVVLHEQPDGGRSIIEKFERHSDVAFAVVLFTPDDEGYRMGHPEEARPRARQNVLYELGYFVGRLNRERVCVLHTGDVEIPSDYLNVLFTAIDGHGAWRMLLARELNAAGIDVDPRKAF